MANADREHLFLAPIQKIWIMRCVEIPSDISRELRSAAGKNITHPAVRGFIEGLPFKSTLVPAGGGKFRLHVHSRIWRKLRIDAGATIEVTLMLEQAPRPAVVPGDLAAALADEPRALSTFHALTLALRRQVVLYLQAAKHASTREKRVKLIVQRMLERAAKKKKNHHGKKPAHKSVARNRQILRGNKSTKKPGSQRAKV